MLSLSRDPSGLKTLLQSTPSPSVYLDQWALMEVSADPSQREKFSRVLLRRKGTLLLSFIHLMEFTKVELAETARLVEQLLIDLDLHFAFLHPFADQVIEAEDRLRSTPPHTWQAPHLDNELLRAFHQASEGDPLDARDFIRRFQKPSIVALYTQFETGTARANLLLAQQRERFRGDSAFRAEMKRPPSGPVIQAPTRYVADEIRRSLIRDATAPMTTNDWADLFHTIVAVSYCDFVILDRRWFAAATQAQRRLKKAGLLENAHFARVFRKLSDFWIEFDV